MKVLFVVPDAGGNLPPALGIAGELQRRGAEVTLLGPEPLRAGVEKAGLRFEPFTTAVDYDPRKLRSTARGLAAFVRLASDPGVGDDALALHRREGFDVVVADTLVTGAIDRLNTAGVPTVVLVHSFSHYFDGLARGPVGLLVRLRGQHMGGVQDSAAMRLITAHRRLDPVRRLPANARHVGVVHQGIPVAATPTTPPTVLVSLSTTAFPGQDHTLQAVLDAVAGLPVQAVVTTGPALDPGTFRVPPNATVHAWLDHGEVLPRASLIIGHGGHSTTMRALAHGVPVLVIPSHNLLDQPMVGAALEQAGVGARLRRKGTPVHIAAAAGRLLADAGTAAKAQALGAELRARDGAEAAAELIEALAARAPGEVAHAVLRQGKGARNQRFRAPLRVATTGRRSASADRRG